MNFRITVFREFLATLLERNRPSEEAQVPNDRASYSIGYYDALKTVLGHYDEHFLKPETEGENQSC